MGTQNPVSDVLGDVQAAVAAGAALGDPRTADSAPGSGVFTVVPKGYELASLEDYLARPLRVRQNVALDDAESFIEYIKAYRLSERTRVFFNQEQGEFLAVLDYHGNSIAPEWCAHRARFKAQQSVEFSTWMGMNRQPMDQLQFARFLEDNQVDVVKPDGAVLLEIALTFETKKDVEFASGVRLQNGQIQFKYNEVVRGSAQSGTLEIPDEFKLGIPVHVGGPKYEIPVRLRWRLKEGKVVFWYEVVRPHRFLEAALKEIRERISAETTLKVLAGSLAK